MSARVRTAGHVLGGCLTGTVVGAVGTVAHRATIGGLYFPRGVDDEYVLTSGVVLALIAVVLAGACMRAWAGYVALIAYTAAMMLSVLVFSYASPGGDLLVPDQPVGLVWIGGGSVLAAIVFFLPRSWFEDVPLRHNGSPPGQPSLEGAGSVESGHE